MGIRDFTRGLFRTAAPATVSRKLDAATPKREVSTFGPSTNQEIAASGARVVGRSRGLYRNSGLVANGVDTLSLATWGPDGARPVGAGKRALARWAAESRRQNLPAKIRVLISDMIVSGDGLGVLNGVNLTVLPREQLDDFSDGAGRVVNGIELDDLGRPTAYRVFPNSPDSGAYEPPIRVPAEDFTHVFRQETASQVRGLPWLTSAVVPAAEHSALLDAVTVAARARASIVMVHTQDIGADAPQPFGIEEMRGPTIPGTIVSLPPGEALEWPTHQMPNEIAQIATLRVREIAAALGIPPFMLDGDYAAITYSSARSALLIFRARVESIQYQILQPMLDRLFERITGSQAPESWVFPMLPSVDPIKDATANKLDLEMGLTSRARLLSERGLSLAEVDAELAAEGRQPAAPKESRP